MVRAGILLGTTLDLHRLSVHDIWLGGNTDRFAHRVHVHVLTSSPIWYCGLLGFSSWGTGLNEHTFHTGTLHINYAEGPANGPLLVLLHGLANRWQTFASLIPTLSQHWRVIAPDFRGHGRSDRARTYRLCDYAEDSLRLLESLSEPAVVIGHSSGGAVALWLAALAPQKVRAVVLADWIYPDNLAEDGVRALFSSYRELARSRMDLDEMTRALADVPIGTPGDGGTRRVGDVPFMDEEALRSYAETLQHVDPDVFTAAIDGMLAERYDPDALLSRVHAPVLVLQGNPARGGLLTDDDVKRALSHVRNGTHVMIEEVGHDMHQERAEPVLEALTPFLASL